MKRTLFIILGSISLLLGIIGMFLPLIPTTPFLLLSAFLYGESSPRFHHWLINHPKLSPPIHDWNKNRVIRTQYKILATIMLAIPSTGIAISEEVPLAGKCIYFLLIATLLVGIWTRKGQPTN